MSGNISLIPNCIQDELNIFIIMALQTSVSVIYSAWEKTPFFAFTYEPKASMSSLQEVTHAETVVLLWYGGLKTSFLD